jgi:hypothetical protein
MVNNPVSWFEIYVQNMERATLLSKLASHHWGASCVFKGFWTGVDAWQVWASRCAVQVKRPQPAPVAPPARQPGAP